MNLRPAQAPTAPPAAAPRKSLRRPLFVVLLLALLIPAAVATLILLSLNLQKAVEVNARARAEQFADLLKAGIVDVIVPEEVDAADDPAGFTQRMSAAIAAELHALHTVPAAQRLGVRLQRYRRIGVPDS